MAARCRAIALDLRASGFSLLSLAHAGERCLLAPCFDQNFPGISAATRAFTAPDCAEIARHLHGSTLPCWWDDEDAGMAHWDDFGWCRRIEPLAPRTRAVALPVQCERGQLGLAIFTHVSPDLAMDDICQAHAGAFAAFQCLQRLRSGTAGGRPTLSRRELECLRLTADGLTSEEIAVTLKLSVHTANQHLASAVQRLHAVNRMHAVAKALRVGLFD